MSSAQISNELYDALPEDVRDQLEILKVRRSVPAGTMLIERGLPPTSVKFVESGKVEITIPEEEKSLHLAVAGPGKVFGLRAAVADALPEINVRCLEPCVIAEVPADRFLEIMRANAKACLALIKVLSADLRMADDLRRRLVGRERRAV